ncbi:hypothetical protein Hanom_Chr09g00777271 [Helianthus anomalus]
MEVSAEQVLKVYVGKGKEKELVVSGKKKKLVKKGAIPTIQGSSGKSVESFEGLEAGEDPAVCAEVLAHFAPPGVQSKIFEMEADHFISRLMPSSCILSALLAEGVSRFTKGMQEYEEASKKKDKMKASMAAMKKEVEGFSKKEEAWVKKVGELIRRHEIEMNDLKKRFEADRLKLKAYREALDVQ